MAAEPQQGTRVYNLEAQAATLSARIDVLEKSLEWITDLLTKNAAVTEGHSKSITQFDERISILPSQKELTGDLKEKLAGI